MDAIVIFIAQYLYLFVLLIGVVFFFMQPRKVQKSMIVCGIIIAPLAYIISRIAGVLYYDPRPFVVGHFVPLIAHVADNGFPSDHVLLTGVVAMVVWFYNKKLSVVLWVLALLIGWARVYSGIHNTADIIGSIVVVLISSAAYYLAVRKKYAHPPTA
jgi:undecaprenyl-diphosphatase